MLNEAIGKRSEWLDEQQALLPIMTALFVEGLGPFRHPAKSKESDYGQLPLPRENIRVFRLPLPSEPPASFREMDGSVEGSRQGGRSEPVCCIDASPARQVTARSLIRGISHHFNNLLMGVWGNATLIRMQLAADDPLYSRMTQMERLIQSGAFLIHMVLGYLGERRTVAKRLRLNQLVREIKNEIHDCGGDEEAPWNFEARLKWASRVQKPRMIASSTARVLEVLFQGIGANCRDIMLKKPSEAAIRQKMQTIALLVERGLKISRQLRLYAGDIKTNPSRVRAGVILKRAAARFGKRHPHIRVSCDIQPGLPTMAVDRPQMESALAEMLDNAGAAMPEGGDLKLCAQSIYPKEIQQRSGKQHYIMISIKDGGNGISPRVQKRIFEPFYSYPLRHGRNGLGLAAVDGILAAHNGYIQVQSAQDAGTCFTLYMPVG